MTPLLSLAQAATVVEPLPEDAASSASDAVATLPVAAVDNGRLDLLQLVLHASLPAPLVMLLLSFASVAPWVIIFRKTTALARPDREAGQFGEGRRGVG